MPFLSPRAAPPLGPAMKSARRAARPGPPMLLCEACLPEAGGSPATAGKLRSTSHDRRARLIAAEPTATARYAAPASTMIVAPAGRSVP